MVWNGTHNISEVCLELKLKNICQLSLLKKIFTEFNDAGLHVLDRCARLLTASFRAQALWAQQGFRSGSFTKCSLQFVVLPQITGSRVRQNSFPHYIDARSDYIPQHSTTHRWFRKVRLRECVASVYEPSSCRGGLLGLLGAWSVMASFPEPDSVSPIPALLQWVSGRLLVMNVYCKSTFDTQSKEVVIYRRKNFKLSHVRNYQ